MGDSAAGHSENRRVEGGYVLSPSCVTFAFIIPFYNADRGKQ